MEIWKPIKQSNNYYISNLGRFKSNRKILKCNVNKKGYLYCNISIKGVVTKVKIHKLVAEAFVNGQKLGYTVNHKDLNKLNNCMDNLEWITLKHNIQHYFKNRC